MDVETVKLLLTPFGTLILGIWLYKMGAKEGGSGTSITIPAVGANDSGASCAEACKQFSDRREERCTATYAEAAAKTAMEGARTAYAGSLSALVAMIAAAFAALALPWPANLIVSLVFWTAATVLTGVMIFMLGKLNAATGKWADASNALMTANNRVMEARKIVNEKCPPQEAAACLNTPNPC